MKKTKILLLVTLGICIISFMPAVVGKADVRPISAFTDTNDETGVVAWVDSEYNLILFPHGLWYDPENITNCEHSGSVLVKDLKDGRILYKVNLHVKGALMLIAYYENESQIFVGKMDYSFITTLIVYGDVDDPVPNLIDVWFLGGGESPFQHITGSGTGIFVDDAAAIARGFAPGATAKVKLNQVGITKPEGHPIYPGIWPVELIFFH